jgi:hypothetical protein
MRAVWGYYESSSIQSRSNANMVRAFNTLKRELNRQQDSLFMDHQQEDVVSGGFANSIQFHYLLVPDTTVIPATLSSSTLIAAGTQFFDANQGATGTAGTYFETRRDFYEPGRGF